MATTPFLRFPNPERLLVEDLKALVGDGHTGKQTPPDLGEKLPFIRVLKTGGGSDRFNDHPTVEVDVFAATYEQAERIAEQVRQRIVGPPPAIGALDRAECDPGPREMPWGDDSIRRFAATYLLTARRRMSV